MSGMRRMRAAIDHPFRVVGAYGSARLGLWVGAGGAAAAWALVGYRPEEITLTAPPPDPVYDQPWVVVACWALSVVAGAAVGSVLTWAAMSDRCADLSAELAQSERALARATGGTEEILRAVTGRHTRQGGPPHAQ